HDAPHHYAIVDEVDNLLIDEARTPLIISGPAEESSEVYHRFANMASRLTPGVDYTVDEKHRTAALTEEGTAKVEKLLGIENIYDPENYRLTRYLEAAVKAQAIYKRDRDYVVKDGQVIIVDEFTGRLMFGRRWSDGLHQAVEAKEAVKVQHETITYATVTLQNYFRMYEKLAGMTGTAATSGEEFFKVYGLEVVVIPTHRPMVRQGLPDQIFRTEEAKFRAVAQEIEECHKRGRPTLVGTTSIEKNEYLAQLLTRRGVPHQVLNAKQHEREAQIIAQAGQLGAVTIATNMAGRGTDIILGGNPSIIIQELCRQRGIDPEEAPPEVLEALRREARQLWQEEHEKVAALGGLHVIGTEHHDAPRIDNQLRGRSGRQGDPGSSRFYASFEDDIMRRFAPEWLPGMLGRLGMDEETPLEHPWVNKAIESAQSKVEGYNFDIRKHLVEYDDVMNAQRENIYRERQKTLEGADLKTNILAMVEEELDSLVDDYLGSRNPEEWDVEGLLREAGTILPLPSSFSNDGLGLLSKDEVREQLLAHAQELYEAREGEFGPQTMRALERLLMLRTIDMLWVEHLTAMEELRQGIGLHAYGQRDPLVVYKREAHDMWGQLLGNIRRQVTRAIYNARLVPQAAPAAPASPRPTASGPSGGSPAAYVRAGQQAQGGRASKVGRNDPCPCGSGRKYKKCHGRAA
ncbi:MAG TPA: preprotein translocase subunit SecA, partial [Dehalococcoidia bacterium]|nr:preprotein translocase subunit SecA [Dehalococcoidia bacterium]